MSVGILILLGLGMAALVFSDTGADSGGSDDAEPSPEATPRPTPQPGAVLDIKAAEGNDNIDLSGAVTPARVSGSAGYDTITTGEGDDTIFGGRGNDSVISGGGDDHVVLADGHDFWADLAPSDDPNHSGNDHVRGEQGNDTLTSHGGADTLYGDTGDDVIDARERLDTYNGQGLYVDSVTGGSGDDVIYADDGDVVTLGKGADQIHADLRAGPGVAANAAQDWDVIRITDFDPAEDRLIIETPDQITMTLADMDFIGTDGEEITLFARGYQLATLTGVQFADLGALNVEFR